MRMLSAAPGPKRGSFCGRCALWVMLFWVSATVAADCPDAEILGNALALVAEANPVLSAEREQFEEQDRQKSWESYLTLGYATNTTFESGEAGGSAAIRVRIPLFDRKHELTVAQARSAWRRSEDALLSGFLTEIGKLCTQKAKVKELDTLRQFYRAASSTARSA